MMLTGLVAALFLVFLRVAGFVAFLPPFAGKNLPNTVKVGLVLCLTMAWAGEIVPSAAPALESAASDRWALLAWLGARETLLGVGLGWLLGLVLVPVRVAGAWIVQEMGLTMGAIASPGEGSESNVVSQLLEIGTVLLLFGLNVHHQFLRLFRATFIGFPVGEAWALPSREWFIASMVRPTDYGLALAAPIGVVLFAGVIATLFLMRQSPQFNLFTFGMPFRLALGLGALIFFLPGMLTSISHTLTRFSSFRGW